MSKPIWQSRTLWVNLALFAVGAIGLVLDMQQALGLPPQWQAYLVLGAALLNLVLRMVTSRPVTLRGRSHAK